METNILKALASLANNPNSKIAEIYKSIVRANSMGDALEYYIKDLFCDSFAEKDMETKNRIYNKYFAYIGNQNNPPDLIIKDGDAIEVKKLESQAGGIALNSSYPKDKLYSDSPMITEACRNCEKWDEKDIVYIVGNVIGGKLSKLWFVYGDCYAADRQIYERIKRSISEGLGAIDSIELAETNEIGRVNKVDPLGITNLRVRGMWHIESPAKVFEYLLKGKGKSGFEINALMSSSKFNSFSNKDRDSINALAPEKLHIESVKIKSPNNLAKLIDAKLIRILAK